MSFQVLRFAELIHGGTGFGVAIISAAVKGGRYGRLTMAVKRKS